MTPPGRRRTPSTLSVLLGLFLLFTSTASAASAVLGIDLGTEYIKAALVKPGIPLEIVLTKDSKRKEASAVAFKPSKAGAVPSGSFPERFYGGDALALAARFPGDVYPNLKTLLGIPLEGPGTIKEYAGRYPALELVGAEDRPTVALRSKSFAAEEKPFSVEELLAMELKNVKENAKVLAGKGTDVSDVVFTIPPFYTADEKRALEVAARLAGLKVLGLVSDGLAVGINYATTRTFPVVNEGGKPEYHMVFDMGAGSTTATILKFQGKTVKDVGRFNKTVQEIHVMGTGWDRSLGGDSLNSLVMDNMLSQFVNSPSAKKVEIKAENVKKHGRTAAKLWKDAEKVRQILSANTQTSSFFEGLYDDVDFRYKISRSEFEDMAVEFANRVDGPIQQALATSGLTMKDLDSVILHGGAVRTPFVQKRLENLAGGSGKLRSNVNSDEAAVFGAAFKAAGLSPSFRVKEIRDFDTQGYAVGVQYMWNLKDRLQKVFGPTSQVGMTKDLPFKMMGEFEFTLYQSVPGGGEELVRSPVSHFRSGNLTRVVTELIDKEGCDRETFDTKVSVRLSPVTGLPEVSGAWVTCETEEEAKGSVMDNVKGFFGMGGKKDQAPLKEGETSSDTAEEASSSTSDPSISSSTSPTSSSSSASASTVSEEPETAESAQASKGKQKKTVTSAITYHVTQQGYEKHPRKEFKRMQDRLTAFDASDKARRVREEVLNSLEAFTYRARDLLEDESFIAASTTAQRSKIEDTLRASSDWIYEEGHSATEEVLNEKLKTLKDLVEPIQKRKEEAAKRPAAIKSLEDALDQLSQISAVVKGQLQAAAESSSRAEEASKSAASSTTTASDSATPSADPLDDLEDQDMLKSSAEIPESTPVPEMMPPMYSEEDLNFLEETKTTIQKWLDEKKAAQSKLSESDDPAISVKDIEAQTTKLNNAFMEILQKQMRQQKPPKPKPTKKPKKPKKGKKKTDEEKTAEGKVTGDEEIKNENEPPLVKLDLGQDASEQEILEALEKATGEAKKYQEGDAEKKHDEL